MVHISSEGKLSIFLGLVGLAGTGAIMVFPTFTPIGLVMIGIAILGFVALAHAHLKEKNPSWTIMEPTNVILLGLLIAFAGLAWQTFRQSSQASAVATGSTNTEPSPTTQSLLDEPAGPRSGPLGPIAAAELFELFSIAPKPCLFRVTAPSENEHLGATIRWLGEHAKCQSVPEDTIKNIDDAAVNVSSVPGIVIHATDGNIFAEKLARFFDAMRIKTATSNQLPGRAGSGLVWIDIGPGSPWKE